MLDARCLEERLRAFYAKHNPGNDQNIKEIVRKFAGRERELCSKLRKKYGEAPDLEEHTEEAQAIERDDRSLASQATHELAYDAAFRLCQWERATAHALDYRSKQFDATMAIHSGQFISKGQFPMHPLDNLLKCRHLLPPGDPHFQPVVSVPVKADPVPKTRTRAGSSGAAATKSSAVKYLESLADTYLDGPFQLLRQCFLDRRRVCVVVRRVNSIRGQCRGFLKAFDKHMNLVLTDVHEHYVPFNTHEAIRSLQRQCGSPTLSKGEGCDPVQHDLLPHTVYSVVRNGRHRVAWPLEHRYAKQLFIRGDNIVMVFPDPLATMGTQSSSSIKR